MQIVDPFAPKAQVIVDPFAEQKQIPQIVDPFAKTEPKQAETKNPFIGALGRVASLAGSGIESVAEVAERLGDKLELAIPLSGISEEDVRNKKQLQPMFDWAKSLKDFDKDLGYQPSTQLKELGSNPLNAIPFIAERVLTSSPDMVAAAGVFPAYVMARTKEILDERVKNDEKTLDEATVGDVTAAATAAVIESTLERFATKGLLKPTPGKTGAGRIGKETGIQAGTETLEEEAAYLGEAAGTKKGLSGEEALTRGLEAAIVGGGLGAGVQGTKEYLNRKPEAAPEKIEEGQPTQAAPVEERVAARAEQLQSQGMQPDDAVKVATRNIADEDAKARAPEEEAAVADVAPSPERVAELTSTLQQQFNLTPAEAETTAVELATEEAKEDALAQRDAAGETDVGQPITEAGGVSPELAGQPDQIAPAAGAEEPTTDGMVPVGEDVAPVDAGEAVEPVALETPPAEEGAQVGAETPEAVQAETQGQEPAPAAEVITPQEIAQELVATEEAKAEEAPAVVVAPVEKPTKAGKKAQDKANLKAVEELEAKFAEVSRPLTDEELESMSQVSESESMLDPAYAVDPLRNRRMDKIKAINDILDMREKMKSASPEVKARINDLINSPAISKQEYDDIVKGRALRAKYSAQLKAAQAPANTAFNKATNGVQALAIITKTGNAFEKELAKRLRSSVQGVKFVVVEKGNEPAALQTEKGKKFWNNASGLFVQNDATGERTVYVAGDSYGELQGINNITVLHELLHAATNQKLYLGLKAIENGFSTDANLTKAVRELQDVMHRVQDYIMDNKGQLPPAITAIIRNTNGMAITDLREFLAYGMSDPDFQEFMMNVQGVEEDVSFFTRFVAAIRDFFKMGEETTNALTDLIVSTDRLLSAKPDARMRFLEAGDKALAQRTGSEAQMSQQVQTITKSTKKQLDKLAKSSFADNLRDTIPEMTALRGDTPMADVLNLRYKNFKLGALKQLLPSLPTETLVQMADRIDTGGGQRGIPGIAQSWQSMGDMIAMRTKLTNAMGKINEQLNDVAAKSSDQYKKLADVMHFSTLISKDPATNKTNPALTRMWGELTPENQKLYEEMRDFYKNNHELYHALLDEQLEASTLPQEAKSKLMASIKKMYEDGKKLYPYFPLMRYGQFWVRVGKGKDGEFHMFENANARDLFVLGRVRQMNESGDKRSREEMIKDLDIDEGNDLTSARRKDDSASDMLKQIFNTIDASKQDGEVKSEALKDEIYQLYLQTLPDRNFRRQYLKRQGKAGFSGDIQRNFINMGTNTANQLARIKYGPTIMNQLERAENSLQGNPDKARLGELVSEMRIRAEAQVRPDPEDGIGYDLAKIANTSAFLWMMTSVKTMVTQFTSIPIFVAPVLASKHGTAKTAAALGKSLNVFNGVGIMDKNGRFTAPSMENLKGLTADEKAAMQYMVDRGLSDNTMAFELGSRRDVSTSEYNQPVRTKMRQISNMMTAMFHHAERLIREVTFMTSYRLNREKLGNTPDAHEKALRLAEAESHEALNNYHASNRPRGIGATSERKVVLDAHKPLGRAILQFKMYPAFVTTYFIRNAYRATRGMDAETRREARIQLIGSLMMSFSLAGYIGIPGISLAMGIAQGILNGLRGEDDDDELENRNLEFWFRNKWMPETFGGVKIAGKGLDEILDRGLITGLTGYDITSSLSMNNMWFPEQKEQPTAVGEMQSWLLSLAGPGASLATQQVPKAIDYFNQGKVMQGMEQLAPALFRGSLTAARYSQEGATTTSGAVIKEPDEFTTGQLLAQSAGFVTEGLQAKREAIFKLQGEIMKVKQERTKLLDRLDLEINKGSDEDVEQAFEKVFKFNSRNPMDAIDNENIRQSLKKQMQRRMMSERGFPIDKKYYPFVADLLEPSTAKLDREAAK